MVVTEFKEMMLSGAGDYRLFCGKYGWDTYLNYLESWNRSDKPRGER